MTHDQNPAVGQPERRQYEERKRPSVAGDGVGSGVGLEAQLARLGDDPRIAAPAPAATRARGHTLAVLLARRLLSPPAGGRLHWLVDPGRTQGGAPPPAEQGASAGGPCASLARAGWPTARRYRARRRQRVVGPPAGSGHPPPVGDGACPRPDARIVLGRFTGHPALQTAREGPDPVARAGSSTNLRCSQAWDAQMQRKFRRSSSPSPLPRPGPPTSTTNRPSPARHAAAQRDLSSPAGLGDHRQPPS